ncbi:MAG: protein phosphatase 2C domain-containing protein [Pyrinomonadaceae bacterium]
MIGTKAMTDTLSMASAAISDRGLSEKRPQNEDSYIEMLPLGIFAVADGVGGAQAGEVASQMAVEILGEAFTNLQPGADAETAMRAAMSQANSAIHQMAHELPQLSAMATTIAALHLSANIATIGHAGDSRVYRLDPNGVLTRETDDHSVVAEEVRSGRMTEEQAENHPSKNIISRALGAEASVEPDLKTIMVEPGTTFLVCSDGITRHVNDDEIKGVLTFGGAPDDVCQFLRKLCYERGAEDNLTAIVVRVGEAKARTENIPVLQLDDDESTVAAARSAPAVESREDDILELDLGEAPTAELPPPHAVEEIEQVAEIEPVGASSEAVTALEEPVVEQTYQPVVQEIEAEPAISESSPYAETVSDYRPTEEAHSVQVATIRTQQPRADDFSMFGTSETAEQTDKSSSLGMIATGLGMLLIGGLVGLGVYHFLLAPQPETVNTGQLTEMRSANIPLSAFEENRRNVDKDPAGYIAKFGAAPQDCEDYYLLGRAYLLSGDFVKAKTAFTEARNRLADADPVNAKTVANEIAISLTVLNDTTVQTMLKKELDTLNKPVNANANANANR